MKFPCNDTTVTKPDPSKLETKRSYNETLKGIEKLSLVVGIWLEGISFAQNGRIYAGWPTR